MNWRFVVKGSLLGLALAAALLAISLRRVFTLSEPPPLRRIPSPAAVQAPAGPLPERHVGLAQWARYRGLDPMRVGSAFFLAVDGEVLAVMTAHSVALGDETYRLEAIGLSLPGAAGWLMEVDTLHGPPGRPRRGLDLTVDYLLFEVPGAVDPGLVLQPDGRGAPRVGERVWLYSGVGAVGERYEGIVYAVDRRGAWVVMQEGMDPAGMSGSPFVGDHTGQVVGMAVAAGWQNGRAVVGMHPVGSLVAKARAAQGPLALDSYRR